jgi:hypothetical protein
MHHPYDAEDIAIPPVKRRTEGSLDRKRIGAQISADAAAVTITDFHSYLTSFSNSHLSSPDPRRSSATPARQSERLGRPTKIVDASKIAHLRSQGHSWREITEETGIINGTAQRTVSSLLKNI